MKFGSERPEIRAVLERDGNRCLACGFRLKCTLSVHHRIPKELGGRDTPKNLITLCVNCHKIVHWLSVGARLEGPESQEARDSCGAGAIGKLRDLAGIIRDHRVRTRQAGNRWIAQPDTNGMMPMADALHLVAMRNHFDQAQARMLRQVVERVLGNLPKDVRKGCSTNLVQRGRYFSIKAGNNPGLQDAGSLRW